MPDRTAVVRAACLATTVPTPAALTACDSSEPDPVSSEPDPDDGRSAPRPFGSPTTVREDAHIAAAGRTVSGAGSRPAGVSTTRWGRTRP